MGLCSFPNATVQLDKNYKLMIGKRLRLNICTDYEVRSSCAQMYVYSK
jgi:hypothetical protein